MQTSILKNILRRVLFLAILGSFGMAHADDQPRHRNPYREEVRAGLTKLQSDLDALNANHQLTSDQYQTVSERVRQLRLQTRVDAEEHEPMTEDDRDTDFDLMRQIDQEASQWVVANSSGVPPSPQ